MTSPSTDHRVIAVRYAERETRLSEVYYGWHVYGEPDEPIPMTYYFWIIQPPSGPPIIVDTGFDPAFAAGLGRRALCPPAEALERLGVDVTAVEQVVVTHLHYDHIGNLDLFVNAEFLVPRKELDFWTTPVARRHHFSHHTDPGAVTWLSDAAERGRVRLVDDEIEVSPGVVATVVGGHSPGQMVVSVDTANGGVLLASDAAHYYDEVAKDRPFAVVADLAEVYTAFDTVRALSAGGRDFVPAHDALVMSRYPQVDRVEAGLAVQIA